MIDTISDESTMTEAEFLDAQAAEAQAAFGETWNDIKGTLRETASLEVWAERHPWLVAGAVAGGFALAAVFFSPAAKEEPAGDEVEEQPAARGTPRRGTFSRLGAPIFSLIQPILGQLITSLVATLVGGIGAAMANRDAESNGMPPADDGGPDGEGPVPL